MSALNYWLSKSENGDMAAAFEAAKIMHFEKFNEVAVQAQLRKAASLGSVEAMRWLGFLGLGNRLVAPESTVTKISYYDSYDQAYDWFRQAAKKDDAISKFAIGLCIRHGIGTVQDVEKSKEILTGIVKSTSIDTMLPAIFLIDYACINKELNQNELDESLIEKMLDI